MLIDTFLIIVHTSVFSRSSRTLFSSIHVIVTYTLILSYSSINLPVIFLLLTLPTLTTHTPSLSSISPSFSTYPHNFVSTLSISIPYSIFMSFVVITSSIIMNDEIIIHVWYFDVADIIDCIMLTVSVSINVVVIMEICLYEILGLREVIALIYRIMAVLSSYCYYCSCIQNLNHNYYTSKSSSLFVPSIFSHSLLSSSITLLSLSLLYLSLSIFLKLLILINSYIIIVLSFLILIFFFYYNQFLMWTFIISMTINYCCLYVIELKSHY